MIKQMYISRQDITEGLAMRIQTSCQSPEIMSIAQKGKKMEIFAVQYVVLILVSRLLFCKSKGFNYNYTLLLYSALTKVLRVACLEFFFICMRYFYWL